MKVLLALLLALGLNALPTSAQAEQPLPEYTVKAALLLKLAKFVTWPAAVEARAEFVLCVLGHDPFDSALEPLRGQKVRGRAVRIVRLTEAARAVGECDLVFVSERDRARAGHIAGQFGGQPVLTVGDAPGFARSTGIVALQTRNRRVGFEVNLAASQSAGLEISSQLLQLATVVGTAQEARRR